MGKEEAQALLMQPIGRTQLQDPPIPLDPAAIDTLLAFLNQAYARLGLAEQPLSADAFAFVLSRKLFTNQGQALSQHEMPVPSYEAEYVHAVELIRSLGALIPDHYLQQLVHLDNGAFDNRGDYIAALVGTRLWHFRMYFLDEYIRYGINVLGGYAAEPYGLHAAGVRNYRGYVGGPFSSEYMPYRLAGS